MGCLIIFKSLTHAQRGSNILSNNGILCSILKAPINLSRGSCSYGLRIKRPDLSKAHLLLSRAGLPIGGYYCQEGGGYREVTP